MDVGCPVCRADITIVMRIFLIWQTMPKYSVDIQPNYCYFCVLSLLCFIKKKHKTRRRYTIGRTDDEENY